MTLAQYFRRASERPACDTLPADAIASPILDRPTARPCARPSSTRRSRKDPRCWCELSGVASAIPTCTCRMVTFLLGDGKKLDVRAGRTLPFTLGHEIAGVIDSVGPDADAKSGAKVAVYPWIGCGQCAACKIGDENICTAPRHLGITVDGGFATHVLVPHPRYLIDYVPLSPGYAGALMCSGLTAYAALKRLAGPSGARASFAGRPRRRRADGPCADACDVRHGAVCRRYRSQKT